MKPIPSTAEIVLFKFLNRSVNDKWVTWACDMLAAGFDSENLRMLAAQGFPVIDSVELQLLVHNTLNDFNIKSSDKEMVVKQYAGYLVNQAIEKRIDCLFVLEKLKDLYLELNDEPILVDFYRLYHMKGDEVGGMKYVHEVDKTIETYFFEWQRICGK